MKFNTTDFLRKAQFPLMLALGMLPAFILIVINGAGDALSAVYRLLPACVLAAWVCMLAPGKVRIPLGILGCAALILLSLRTLPILSSISTADRTLHIGQSALCGLLPILLCALLLYSLQFASWEREREIAFNWYAAGVIAHLFAQLTGFVARRQGPSVWDEATPVLTAAFILFMVLVLLSMNRTTMLSASLGRQRIPLSMRRRNVAITLSLMGGALLIAGIPAIVQFVERVWSLLLSAVLAVMAFIARLLETEDVPGTGGAGGGMDMMPYVEVQEPSLLAVILEKIAMAAALIAAVLLLLFAMRQTLRAVRALMRRIRAHFARYIAVASQDYVDEITDTREDGSEASGSLLDRIRRRMAWASERGLSPSQRIRQRYRLLLRRHPDWHMSRTARENLPDETAALYEAARYSGREVSDEEADAFKKAVS